MRRFNGICRRWIAATLFLGFFSLAGCSGGGGGGEGRSVRMQSPLEGHWVGSATNATSGEVFNATAFVDETGDAQLVVHPRVIYTGPVPSAEVPPPFSGTINPQITPHLSIYAIDTQVFVVHGNVCCGTDFRGDAQIRELRQPASASTQIEGRVADGLLVGGFAHEGSEYSFSLAISEGYEQPLTMNDLAGVYVAPTAGFCFEPCELPPVPQYTVAINNDGTITGTYYDNCIYNGTVTIPDPSRNLFRLRVQLANCSVALPSTLNGEYEGMGVLHRGSVIAPDLTTPYDTFYTSLIGLVWLGSQAAIK